MLAGMTNMLSTIVTAVIAEIPDGLVAGRIGRDEALDAAVMAAGADVIVLQDEHPGDVARHAALLRRFPRLRVVELTADGMNCFVHQMRPSAIFVADLSAGRLRGALEGDIEGMPH